MKVTIDICDDAVAEFITKIVAALPAGSAATETVVEEDDFGGGSAAPAPPTLTQVQDAVGAAVGKHGKDKVKAIVKKIAGADKVSAIPEDKFQAVLDAIAKLK